MRRRLARFLRNTADTVDRSSGPRSIGLYFTIVPGQGLVTTRSNQLSPPVPGVPLWFMAEDYHRAFRAEP